MCSTSGVRSMFYLTGTAATSALDLIATLQQTLGANNAGGTQAPAAGFDAATAASGGTSSTTGAASDPTSGSTTPQSLLAPNTLDALLAVQGQNQAPIVNGDAFSQQLFSLLDTNGDGSISKSEFETAFGQNGNTTQADQIFAKLDANGDGSISQSELTNALDGQDQAQGGQGVHHHHHHHMGGMDGMGEMGGAGASGSANGDSSGGSTDPLAALGGTSQSVTNSDGSTTTTISYADGSSVSMTTPAASSSNSGSTGNGSSGSNAGALNNYIEQMIQRQAQWLSSQAAGQSLAVSV